MYVERWLRTVSQHIQKKEIITLNIIPLLYYSSCVMVYRVSDMQWKLQFISHEKNVISSDLTGRRSTGL